MEKNKSEETKPVVEETMQEPVEQEPAAEQAAEEMTPEQRVESLEAEVKELQQKVAALEDTKLRQMAEFDNFRRRTNKEKLDLLDTAGEKIFKEMLPLVDDFERALKATEEQGDTEASQKALQEGVQLIYQKFLQFLSQNKVTPIDTTDKPFSTDEHEAITTLDMGEEKRDKIIECVQKGYKLGDKILRYAKVVVGK